MFAKKIALPASGLALLAASFSSLHAEWRSLGPFGGSIHVVHVDPHHRDTVLAATANALFFRSGDGGESWAYLPFPAELRATLHTLMFDPVRPDTYYAGLSSENPQYAGLYRSGDAGASWQRLPGLANQQVWSLSFWQADGRVIAAGTEDGLHLSLDHGATWRRISPESLRELRPVVSVAFEPKDRNVIYAGTPHLAWKTNDGGAHWVSIPNGMQNDSDIFSIAVDRILPGRIFASACSGIYRSLDSGANWTKLNTPKDASRSYFVRQHPSKPNVVYAGTNSGLMQSLDGGATWRRISPHPARAIAFDAARSGRVFLATDDAGVLRSDDDGQIFRDANQGICSRRLSPLAASGGVVFSSIIGERTSRGVFKLPVAASRWEGHSKDASAKEFRRVAPMSGAAEHVYAIAGGTLMRSTDGGGTWVSLAAPGRLTALLAPSTALGRLFVATETAVYSTKDEGRIWEKAELPVSGVPIRELVAISPSAIGVIAGSRLILSSDGTHWKSAARIPGNPHIFGLAGAGTKTVVAATGAGLMRSDDFGDSWDRTGGELRGTTIRAIASDPARDGVYFAAAFGMVYETSDGGETWRRINPQAQRIGTINQLLLLPGEPDRLLALTEERGVFELERKSPPK